MQPARGASQTPPPLRSPSAQFLRAVMQLQTLCTQCVEQTVHALARDESPASTVSAVPWSIVHAVAMLGEALHESRFADLPTSQHKALPVRLSDSAHCIVPFNMMV